MSSPEAQSGSSSSEDEFDFSASTNATTSSDAAVSKDNNEPAKSESTGAATVTDHSKLFSDDEDDDDDDAGADKDDSAASAQKQEKSSDDDGRKEKEMEDLFGSDYDSEEEEFKASGIKESPVREENRSHALSDAFPDDAPDHGGSHSSEVWIPKTPKAPKSASYFITKMPNILRLVPDAYTKQSIEEEMQNPSDETLYRNYVRWRYQRDASGRVKLDPQTQRPLRESNTKLVQWEDGTLTMFVGKEALNLTRQKIANSFLFVNEMSSDKPEFDDEQDVTGQETVLECHARLHEKFTIRPMTTSSKSHKSLTMSMRAKHNKGVQKIKEYISELDGYREQEQRVKIMDDRLRLQNRKKARQGYEYDRERASRMDATFLEEGYDGNGGDYDDDENVGAIKEQFGGRGSAHRSKSGGAAGRKHAAAQQQQRRAPAQSSYHGAGFDEYRKNRAREAEKSDSEHDDGDEEQDEEDDEEMVIRSTKKRRTVDEDSD